MQQAVDTFDSTRSIRYLTLGCGLLLTDLQILNGLRMAGLAIEMVIAVDHLYSEVCEACDQVELAKEPPNSRHASAARLRLRLAKRASASKALSQLAAYVAPARTVAFGSVEAYLRACAESREAYAGVSLMVQIDANEIGQGMSRLLAARALGEGGLAFRLDKTAANHGEAGTAGSAGSPAATPAATDSSASTKPFVVRMRRSSTPKPPPLEPHLEPDVEICIDAAATEDGVVVE